MISGCAAFAPLWPGSRTTTVPGGMVAAVPVRRGAGCLVGCPVGVPRPRRSAGLRRGLDCQDALGVGRAAVLAAGPGLPGSPAAWAATAGPPFGVEQPATALTATRANAAATWRDGTGYSLPRLSEPAVRLRSGNQMLLEETSRGTRPAEPAADHDAGAED